MPRLPWGAVPAGVVLGVVVVVSGLWLKDLGPGNPDRGLVDLVQQARSRALNVLALVLRYGLSVLWPSGGWSWPGPCCGFVTGPRGVPWPSCPWRYRVGWSPRG